MGITRAAAIGLSCLLLLPAASDIAAADPVVVLDLGPEPIRDDGRVFAITAVRTRYCQDFLDDLIKTQTTGDLTEIKRLITGNAVAECSDSRWIASRGARIHALVLYVPATLSVDNAQGIAGLALAPAPKDVAAPPDVQWEEVSRKSQLAEDASDLLDIIRSIRGFRSLAGSEVVPYWAVYRLKERRAKLVVRAKYLTEEKSAELVTGPTEHWYLSADLPVNSVRELKFDETAQAVLPKDAPKQVFAGANFMLGDRLSAATRWYDQFVLKAMVRLDKEPLEKVGLALAYRFDRLEVAGKYFGALSPFVGYIWSKESTDASASASERRYQDHFQYGISVNLDAAAEWVKKDGK